MDEFELPPELLELAKEVRRKMSTGDYTERDLKRMDKFREYDIKLITELDTLTPLERKYLLNMNIASETVDAFLQDQDEFAQISPEELAKIVESANHKFEMAIGYHMEKRRKYAIGDDEND